MMHLRARRRLSASLDGELPARAMLAVERHVARCPRCAGRRESLRRARAAVQASARSAPPPEAWARLRDRMAAPAPPAPRRVPRRRRPAWTMAGAAAGALAALGVSLYLGFGRSTSGLRPPAPHRNVPAFVTTADLVDQEPVSLSPSIELLLVAREDGGTNPGEDR
jgi:anti-sigma factor RsiW